MFAITPFFKFVHTLFVILIDDLIFKILIFHDKKLVNRFIRVFRDLTVYWLVAVTDACILLIC